VKWLREEGSGGQNSHRTRVLDKSVFPVTSGVPSWKWLLAIPLVYAAYDRQGESMVFSK